MYCIPYYYSIYTVRNQNLNVDKTNRISSYSVTIETCNTAMERKFCGLLGDVFKNCEKCSYEAKLAFFWIAENSDI